MADLKGILICGEVIEGKITTITKELLHTGQELSQSSKERINLLLLGKNVRETVSEATALGADLVFIAEEAASENIIPERIVAIVARVFDQTKPLIILLGQNDMGRDIAPRLGARVGANVCLDCVKLEIDHQTQSLLQSKPVFGGRAIAVWVSAIDRPQVITMRLRASEPALPDPALPDPARYRAAVIVKAEADESMRKSVLLETVEEAREGLKLEEAKVIVSGGGGIGGREGFEQLQELARVLHGAVGISRVPKDEKWMPAHLEIGQTGHIVSPDLYIAVGISGAPQHLAGCAGSRHIVAINKDPQAHIFREANFGIVGDYREALPAFIEKCKALTSQT